MDLKIMIMLTISLNYSLTFLTDTNNFNFHQISVG